VRSVLFPENESSVICKRVTVRCQDVNRATHDGACAKICARIASKRCCVRSVLFLKNESSAICDRTTVRCQDVNRASIIARIRTFARITRARTIAETYFQLGRSLKRHDIIQMYDIIGDCERPAGRVALARS
jgi:hypothetical protein